MQGNAMPDSLRRFLLVSRLTAPHVDAVLLMGQLSANSGRRMRSIDGAKRTFEWFAE